MSRIEKIVSAGIILIIVIFARTLILDSQYQWFISDPEQVNLATPATVIIPGKEGDASVTLVAEYTIEAVVRGKEKYSDYPFQISSYDLILAWGDLNRKDMGKYIRYSQSGRWYYFRYYQGLPVSVDYM